MKEEELLDKIAIEAMKTLIPKHTFGNEAYVTDEQRILGIARMSYRIANAMMQVKNEIKNNQQ